MENIKNTEKMQNMDNIKILTPNNLLKETLINNDNNNLIKNDMDEIYHKYNNLKLKIKLFWDIHQ